LQPMPMRAPPWLLLLLSQAEEVVGTKQWQLYVTKHCDVKPPVALHNAGLRDLETELVVPNMTSQDMALVAQISVGTPPQSLTVLLDSGSTDMWLPSQHCKTCLARGVSRNRYFNAYDSRTAEIFEPRSNSKYYVLNTIRYGSGVVQGVLIRDTVDFAGITITHQSFLLAEKEHMQTPGHIWDGIMGLAMPSLAMDGPPIFTKLLDAGVAPVFAFVPDAAKVSRAQLHIGGEGYAKFVKPRTLQWVNTTSDTFWIVDAHVGVTHPVQRSFLIDTGTSLLLMPPQDMVWIVHRIAPRPRVASRCMLESKLAMVFCACDDVDQMRPLHFFLGNKRFSLTPSDLFEPTNATLGGPFEYERACGLLVSVTPKEHGTTWIVGDVFLRRVVTVFDFERGRVGFGQLKRKQNLHISKAWSEKQVVDTFSSGGAAYLFCMLTAVTILATLVLASRASRHCARTVLPAQGPEAARASEELRHLIASE